MRLSKKAVGTIISLIVVSLVGLVLLQIYLLNLALEQKGRAFDRNVMAALNSVVGKLESEELSESLTQLDEPDGILRKQKLIAAGNPGCVFDTTGTFKNGFAYEIAVDDTGVVKIEDGVLNYRLKTPQHVAVYAFAADGSDKKALLDTFKASGEHQLVLEDYVQGNTDIIYKFNTDSIQCDIRVVNGVPVVIDKPGITGDEKRIMVTTILNRLTDTELESIEKRIDVDNLRSNLSDTFRESGIDLEFSFGVRTLGEDTLRIADPGNAGEELLTTEFKAGLFPRDIIAPPNELLVFFPGRDIFLLKKVGPLLGSTILFMMVVVACFVYTVRTMIYQKRFAGRLVDFINNMTHEFKTPISTISLAGEAIGKPEVVSDVEKVSRFNTVIRDETDRMKKQVDKILQMAILEKGDFKLEKTAIDVHQFLRKSVKSISLMVENHNGVISIDFKASNFMIEADRVHLSNVIHNILENAIKYSENAPEITISTANVKDEIIINIADNGPGIDPAAARMVFDKYYRVPTGNQHDVKGFGLGLSYVKLIIEAHGGRVGLESRPGTGTTVSIHLPLRS
ncbi:MAG: HAMP domain-containing histidine kinase [Candidatus Zixiibacteriota bacterium]|nr:MAG: HAMP domain-containing histidine kinase [candidate division Zixibacteria bacterium]